MFELPLQSLTWNHIYMHRPLSTSQVPSALSHRQLLYTPGRGCLTHTLPGHSENMEHMCMMTALESLGLYSGSTMSGCSQSKSPCDSTSRILSNHTEDKGGALFPPRHLRGPTGHRAKSWHFPITDSASHCGGCAAG